MCAVITCNSDFDSLITMYIIVIFILKKKTQLMLSYKCIFILLCGTYIILKVSDLIIIKSIKVKETWNRSKLVFDLIFNSLNFTNNL